MWGVIAFEAAGWAEDPQRLKGEATLVFVEMMG